MTFGYARVSTVKQDERHYRDAINAYAASHNLEPVAEIIEETVTGKKHWSKRKLGALVDRLQPGDVVIAPEMSRLGRTIHQLTDIGEAVKEKGAVIHLAKENRTIPGQNPADEFFNNVMASFAQFELQMLSERTKEALAAKKAKGIKLGRPKGPGKSKLDGSRAEIVRRLEDGVTQKRIAEDLGVSTVHLSNYIKKNDLQLLTKEDIKRNPKIRPGDIIIQEVMKENET
ncbi:recombinase family protein [Marispirochaeta aestuarii]|uniref:recombinase family protein n=1 Tax=Marispirochaeta aestuarii TaxID=1963862 RepID=UPI0029C7EBD5|nr:recombinase family protein [Marispirochaeta aestuarii]